jgi:hypothetical protein
VTVHIAASLQKHIYCSKYFSFNNDIKIQLRGTGCEQNSELDPVVICEHADGPSGVASSAEGRP